MTESLVIKHQPNNIITLILRGSHPPPTYPLVPYICSSSRGQPAVEDRMGWGWGVEEGGGGEGQMEKKE